MSDLMLLGMELLAQDEPRQTGPDFGKASPVGLIIVVLLLVAVFGLVWSMNRHLRKLPKSFGADADTDTDGSTEDPADGTKRESNG
ncbi:hypothetical protein MPRF_27110 [Mycolicibacterium parafortuitum]|uniref:Uncharacterized protein n=1 Tax=Mycolicibacterium parafortuitum TaxID=39692 RepID=A0A7I7U3B8_MYCPF|nr:hypothetical protein [Mycolicibacterium parafortuitum]PQD99266.1 hypothetical protein CYL16_17735 [Mycobacterium sp. EPG1]BBY75812.1 hypothetical protein MPRF_27110 [Mycolicibacterium parafortuitum]